MQKYRSVWLRALTAAACCGAPQGAVAAASAEKVIHAFQGGSDGATPYFGGLIADAAGNAYGTTAGGGDGCSDGGCGTVFKLTKGRKEGVLYAFKGGSDGAAPYGALMLDASGNLYGTTVSGGGCTALRYGCGTVFKLAPDGTETVLYAFQGGGDGYFPEGNVVMDQSGNLYGTTGGGGTYNAVCTGGCGIIFEVQPNRTEITLYQFQGGSDGAGPNGALIADSTGNLFGTTGAGGGCSVSQYGCGTVFEVTPGGQESILYAFQGGTDGYEPYAGVVTDGAGNLYGTTLAGGAGCCGTVFEVPAGGGSESVLYSFRGGSDGALPIGVVRDTKGDLYGSTETGGGGGKGCKKELFGTGCGTVFKLTPAGKETVLDYFKGKRGELPVAPLLLGKNGALYGTTLEGGTDEDGVVFELKK